VEKASLEQLELLRRLAVDRRRSALVEVRAAHEGLLAKLRELVAQRADRERNLRAARATFATATTVAELRRAQAFMGGEHDASARLDATLASLSRRCREAAEKVRAAEAALNGARVDERSVQRVRERHAREVSRRTEQRDEELADELFRARLERE
jgi:flagellar biosynthesis chaperone FliJ